MSAWSKEVLGRGGYAALKVVKSSLSGRSPEDVHRIGARLGRFLGNRVKRRRNVVVSNLGIAFPEMTTEERLELSTCVFEHFGRAAADFLSSEGRTLERLRETTDLGELPQAMDEALSKGKGAFMVSGHLGNWERIPACLSLLGYPMTVIIRDADSQGVNRLVNGLREAPGTKVLPRGQATRPMLERLKANEIVGILPDQNADDAFIPFFGHPAGTAMGLGVLAERTGAAIVPVGCMHIGGGQYKMVVERDFQPIGENTVKGESVMRGVHGWLESMIRQYPEQWLWFHDRWRSAKERGLV